MCQSATNRRGDLRPRNEKGTLYRDITSESELSDDRDETFNVANEVINSSDSERFDEDLPEIKVKKQKSRKMKKKKEKPNKISRKSKVSSQKNAASTPCRSLLVKKKYRASLEKSKKESLMECSIKEIIRKFHTKRLDNLLQSKELTRIPILGNGNCFFSAVIESTSDFWSSEENLRGQLCMHLSEHRNNYISFLPSRGTTEEENVTEYHEQVSKLQISGNWNCSLADCFPLALANMTKSLVRIYSSAIATPCYDVNPDMVEIEGNRIICLAHMAIRGEEHYEGTTKFGRKPELVSNTAKTNDDTFGEAFSLQRTPSKNKDISPCVTPHKRAQYISPKKKSLVRKRKLNKDKWKRSVLKERRCRGLDYVSAKGIKIPERRKIKSQNCSKCRFKCNENLSDKDRQTINESYYNLGSYSRQRDFICQMVDEVTPVRCKGKKKVSRQFHLIASNKRIRVCRDMFLSTLNIGTKTLLYTVENKKGMVSKEDQRGKHRPANKTDDDILDSVRTHIESFPQMEAHYVRKDSKRKYLPAGLNINRMWNMYKRKCLQNNQKYASAGKYRAIFCNEYNYSFYKPKKDQCSLCVRYNQNKEAGKVDDEMQKKFEEHQQRKEESRHEKERAKEKAKVKSKFSYAATFDLQAVLTTPCSLVGELYYTRKLCCYNLSVYSLGDGNGLCHLWDETQGKRGANEISTCLIRNTSSICASLKKTNEITYFSDACIGQNRNRFVSASLLYSINNSPESLQVINHKFLESGHSQMECDSMHACIEGAKKETSVFVPSQWNTVVTMARKKKPFVVIPMKYTDVYDMKTFVSKYCPNMKTSTCGQRINWNNITWVQVRKSSPDSIFLNYTFSEENFMEIKVSLKTRKTSNEKVLQAAYKAKIPISAAKKKDLIQLCDKGIIPEEFHAYYNSLPAKAGTIERVPLPGSDESDDTDE